MGTILAITVSFGMVQDYSDTHHAFLRGALLARTSFGVRVLDKASGEGPKFDGECFKFGRGEPLNGILTNEIVLKPTYSTTPPSWVTGS